MANVILIGATGFVGSAVLNELVERGHHVTAVVRNAAKLPKSSQVEAVEADVADVEKVAHVARTLLSQPTIPDGLTPTSNG